MFDVPKGPLKEVLIVEDDEIIATLIERFLIQKDYVICGKVSSGEDAIYAVTEHLPNVVLMDINLSGAIDGITATKYITSVFKIPVIFISGTDDDETLEKASVVEPASFIIKPFTAKDIYTNVEIAIRNDLLLKKSKSFDSTKVRKIAKAALTDLDAFFLIDNRGRILFMNPYAEHLLNIERKKAVMTSISRYLTFYDTKAKELYRDAYRDVIKESLVLGVKHNIALKMSDESYRHVVVHSTGVRDSANESIGMFVKIHMKTKSEV